MSTGQEPLAAGPAGPDDHPRYVGLATRAVAFAIDAALIDLAAVVVGVAATLILSLLHLPKGLKAVLAVGEASRIALRAPWLSRLHSSQGPSCDKRSGVWHAGPRAEGHLSN